MRLLGALLVFLSFICGGLIMWNGKKSRYQALNQLCLSLELAVSELNAKNTALPELIELLSSRCCGITALFYADLCRLLPMLGDMEFSSMWCSSAKKNLTVLEADELETVIKLGFILGRYQLTEQLSALKQTLRLIGEGRDAARDNYLRDRKLSIGLPTAVGALLAIVCI